MSTATRKKPTVAETLCDLTYLRAYLRNHVERHYRDELCLRIATSANMPSNITSAWPVNVILYHADRNWALAHTAKVSRFARETRAWAARLHITVDEKARNLSTTMQVPYRATIPTFEDSLRIIDEDARHEQRVMAIQRLMARAKTLTKEYGPEAALRVMHDEPRRLESLNDTDFDVMCSLAKYAKEHTLDGLTPRQVPIPGVSAKWLDATGAMALVGAITNDKPTLATRPTQVDFAYLDPCHAQAGLPHYDSWVEGDTRTPIYEPEIAIVVENLDCMRFFPQTHAKAICIFGAGHAHVRHIAKIPWLTTTRLLYWGDIDVDGYRILNELRASGTKVESILMDDATYRAYHHFGTNSQPPSRNLTKPIARLTKEETDDLERSLSNLTPKETSALRLCARTGSVRRIEQERLPFPEILY